MFSDECSVERGAGQRREWVWCRLGQRLDPNKVQEKNKDKNYCQIIFGAFSGELGRTNLCIIEGDPEGGNYILWSYVRALKQVVKDYITQQDNIIY